MARILFNHFDFLFEHLCARQYFRQNHDCKIHPIQRTKKASKQTNFVWSGLCLSSFLKFISTDKKSWFQVAQLLTSIGFCSMILTSLIAATPIKQLLTYGCEIFYFLAVAHNTIMIVGGFMMALFRILCIKLSGYLVVDLTSMVNIILLVQYALISCLVSAYCVAAKLYGSSSLLEFCHGYTTEVKLRKCIGPILSIWNFVGCSYCHEIWGYWGL